MNSKFRTSINVDVKGGAGHFGETSSSALEFENSTKYTAGRNLLLPYRAPPPTHTNAHMTNEGTR